MKNKYKFAEIHSPTSAIPCFHPSILPPICHPQKKILEAGNLIYEIKEVWNKLVL